MNGDPWSGKVGFQVSGLTNVSTLALDRGAAVLTSMDNIVIVQVIDCLEDLSYRLRRVFLRELPILADTIEKLPTGS